MRDILTMLYNGNCDHSSLEYTFKLLSRACHEPLKEWGSSIANTDKDPAISLLKHLVFEDKTSILVNMTSLFSQGKVHPAFHDSDIFVSGGRFCHPISSHEIASYIHSQNEEFDEEGMPSHMKSTGLFLWARWLEGDREVEDRLMYAIASRFWRIAGEDTRDFIRGIALYAHAHLFYNMGWNPETKVLDLPAVKTDYQNYLAGKTIPFASEKELMDGGVEQQAGSSIFNCVPRVPMRMCESTGIGIYEPRTLCPIEKVYLPIVSFGDDGIGILGNLGDQKMVYFLHYPEEYEEGAYMVWDMMDRGH